MRKPGEQLLRNGAERAEYGCICTFENADGKTFSVHRTGPLVAAFNKACDIALALDPTFLLVSYSTPGSIFLDLQGSHRVVLDAAPAYSDGAGTNTSASNRALGSLGEARICGYAKRPEMLHPRLVVAA